MRFPQPHDPDGRPCLPTHHPDPGRPGHLTHTNPVQPQDADALQTHPEAGEFLVGDKHAHYLFCVKANQPTLLARCQRLPWHRVPVLDRTRDRGYGRVEIRTLKAVSVGHFGFPHAVQVLQVTRKTRKLQARPRRFTTVTVYAVTSLTHAQASPARLADLICGHWAVEALHHLRDVTFAEDACQVRTGSGPHVMATLRNLVIGVPGRAGQRRRRAAPPRPRPPPTPGDPRRQPREQPQMTGHRDRRTAPWGLGTFGTP